MEDKESCKYLRVIVNDFVGIKGEMKERLQREEKIWITLDKLRSEKAKFLAAKKRIIEIVIQAIIYELDMW